MSVPKLVIFDCDGVLVDTETQTNSVISANLARYGLELTIEECAELFVGGTIAAVEQRARAMGCVLPFDWIDEIYAEQFAVLQRGVGVIPGVIDTLDRLDAASIRYCVGSNGPMAKMKITLKPSGLWRRFEGRIFSPHVIGMEYAKPAPGLFLHAACAMGVEPEDAVVIEDSYSGACAALAAGMRCFGYCAETPQQKIVLAGATPFDDMARLPDLLSLTT